MEMHTTLLFILLLMEGINSITLITKQEINVTLGSNTTVGLNCTYSKDISVITIKWTKLINGDYKPLAVFIPGSSAVFTSGIYLKNRANLTNPQNGSTSAILIINDVMCEDDGKYQCYIEYDDGGFKYATNETTVFVQVKAEHPYSFEIYNKNGTLKENDEIILSCSANVGNPGGFVAIWRVNNLSNQSILLNKTSEINEKTENCTAIANLTIPYTVSRDDNLAFFRCSSQNRQTENPAPDKETRVIEVQYGPSQVTIKNSSSLLDLFIGANINLTCSSDGNPPPTFKWKFNSIDILSDNRHSFTSYNRTLILMKMVSNDSGVYSCFASNLVDGNSLVASSNITLEVKENKKEDVKTSPPTCDENPCQITEICSEVNGRVNCGVNHWFFAAVVFIFSSVIFVVATTYLCITRTRHNNSSFNFNGDIKSGDHSESKTNDYDFDGYSDPKDVTKLCAKKSESENVTYADPVDNQYASVQKDSTKTSNPPNVYDGAWV